MEAVFVPDNTWLDAPIVVEHDDRQVILAEPVLFAREVKESITLVAGEEW